MHDSVMATPPLALFAEL
jgi:hypothetical protein